MRVNDYLEIPTIGWFDQEFKATEAIYHPKTRERFQSILDQFDKAKNEKSKLKANDALTALYEELFPGTADVKWFRPETPISAHGQQVMTSYLTSIILGFPWLPPGKMYTHEKAEQMLNYLADERANALGVNRYDVLKEVDEALKKK